MQMLSIFENNMISIHKEKGEKWLSSLPETVNQLASEFSLTDLTLLKNLTYHYILSGYLDKKPIILKIGLDHLSLQREAKALKAFANYGAVQLLIEKPGLLLLEHIKPGYSLKYNINKVQAVDIVCDMIEILHQAPYVKNDYVKLNDWLKILEKNWNIPLDYLTKARNLSYQLLSSTKKTSLLHGDLHHDNILKNTDNWVIIDPKGVIGEPEFEVVAFLHNLNLPIEKIETDLKTEIDQFAKRLKLDPIRIQKWCFVYKIVTWCWSIQDGLMK